MLKLHRRHIEAAHTGLPCPDAPLAHFLPEQRAGLSPRLGVETAGPFERLAPERHVHTERHPRTELDRLLAVIQKGDDRPLLTTMIGQPGGAGSTPEREHASANIVTLKLGQASRRRLQPLCRHPHVIVCGHDDLAPCRRDAGVESGTAALLRFEEVAQRCRKLRGRAFHDRPRVVR